MNAIYILVRERDFTKVIKIIIKYKVFYLIVLSASSLAYLFHQTATKSTNSTVTFVPSEIRLIKLILS